MIPGEMAGFRMSRQDSGIATSTCQSLLGLVSGDLESFVSVSSLCVLPCVVSTEVGFLTLSLADLGMVGTLKPLFFLCVAIMLFFRPKPLQLAVCSEVLSCAKAPFALETAVGAVEARTLFPGPSLLLLPVCALPLASPSDSILVTCNPCLKRNHNDVQGDKG